MRGIVTGGVGHPWGKGKKDREYVFNANWHQDYQNVRHLLCRLRTKDEICVKYILPKKILGADERALMAGNKPTKAQREMDHGSGLGTILVYYTTRLKSGPGEGR
jgi:hypothetical protein